MILLTKFTDKHYFWSPCVSALWICMRRLYGSWISFGRRWTGSYYLLKEASTLLLFHLIHDSPSHARKIGVVASFQFSKSPAVDLINPAGTVSQNSIKLVQDETAVHKFKSSRWQLKWTKFQAHYGLPTCPFTTLVLSPCTLHDVEYNSLRPNRSKPMLRRNHSKIK